MTHIHLRLLVLGVCLTTVLSACVTVPESSVPEPSSHAFDGLHWFRNSAEKRAIYEQTYRGAYAAAQ
jgi:hypothetical protein